MQLFVEHPDQCALLAQRPELAQNAVEELIRWNPTVMWATRRTTEDMEFGGLALPEGTTLHLLSYPANTDPLAVGEGGRFDIMAERPPHFGFGGGAHHCIGHWLARIDMRGPGGAADRVRPEGHGMRVVVDDLTCQHHGQCMIECPGVFQLVSPQELRYQSDVDASLRDDVEAAADACPTMSITIED
jgi:ferredoxin